MDTEDQIEANKDLESKLDEEDSQMQAMEDLITMIAEGASQKQLQQYKALLRRKNIRRARKTTRGPPKRMVHHNQEMVAQDEGENQGRLPRRPPSRPHLHAIQGAGAAADSASPTGTKT